MDTAGATLFAARCACFSRSLASDDSLRDKETR